MPRSSREIARRLRFDHQPRRDLFRRWYLFVGLVACGLAGGIWLLFSGRAGDRQYLPGPVTTAHATFGDRCAHCHVSFASTPNEKCESCHVPGPHTEFQTRTPACRECHAEHRGSALLVGGTDQPCVTCHAQLESTHRPLIAAAVADFAAHPEFQPLRDGASDPARLRFNHAIHLSSNNLSEKLSCANCHVVADGGLMAPINFETHCRRCHELKVKEAPPPLGDIEAPHDTPQVVRAALRDRLAALAVARPQEIFEGGGIDVLIPGQVPRGAVDDARTLQEFQKKWVARFESELYRPFTDSPPLLENNKYCFLCHMQGATSAAGGLPVVEETRIPMRWLGDAHFSHAAHDKLDCAVCHDAIRQSADTATVNLPRLAVCQQCHVDGRAQSAGTTCTLCHVYHRSAVRAAGDGEPALPAPRPTVALETLLGR